MNDQPIHINFGDAVSALKSGLKVARAGWNGKNMFIYLNKGAHDSNGECMTPDFIGGVSFDLFEAGDTGILTRMPNLNMRAADGFTITGWLASQTDILAEDWVIL
jgi:hypothetical protein